MVTIEQLRKLTQSCLDVAEQYPEPYRTQALATIGKKSNWPAKLERINKKVIKELKAVAE